ncbi:CHASE domain-containing protein [Ramlibacter sp.]|uniref:CHASE domain-containing protein n=1 Tax=Ramlibacter sp. TaxID=1917967 RepID=UPI002FCC2500
MSATPEPAPPDKDAARKRSAWLAPAAVFALALSVTAVLLLSVTRSIELRDRAAFEAEASRTADAVRERIDTTITLLHGVTGLFAASRNQVSRHEFADYMAQLDLGDRYPGILGIGYTVRLEPAEVPHLEERMRSQGGEPDFRVWPPDPRPTYYSIVHLEPLNKRNRAAIGYDMSTNPVRRAAMERARDLGRPAASGKVTLVQEIDADKQAGFLIYLPVYRGERLPRDLAERRGALEGFVYAPLRVGDLLQGVRGSRGREIDFALYDGEQIRSDALMRSTREPQAVPPAYSAMRQLDVAGRPWLLVLTSRPALESRSQRRLVPWLAALSVAVSALLAWITLVQARARRAAESAAQQRRLNELALRASEERARERAQRLEQLYEEQRESDRRKDEFLAVLAHELRNPLAPIRNSLEILNRAPDGELARRARAIAVRQVRQMVRLIDDLLDVSRISRGKIVLQVRRVRLAEVVDAAVETSRPLMEEREHRLHAGFVDPDLELDADPTRVAQILTNLLNNAANYTPPGGDVWLLVSTPGPGEVRIVVRDNGIGIEPQKLREIFDLFMQVNRSPAGGGLGIGLSLAARLAEMHGGRIEARSEGLGRGAEFVLVLPRAGHGPAAEHAPGAVADAAGG